MTHANTAPISPCTPSHKSLLSWARHWFAAHEYCPRCHESERLTIVDTRWRESRYDKWACFKCQQRWIVEIQERETAIAAVDGHSFGDADFIERDTLEAPPSSPTTPRTSRWTTLLQLFFRPRGRSSAQTLTRSQCDAGTQAAQRDQLIASLMDIQQSDPDTFIKRAISYAHRAIQLMDDAEIRAECHRWCEKNVRSASETNQESVP